MQDTKSTLTHVDSGVQATEAIPTRVNARTQVKPKMTSKGQ